MDLHPADIQDSNKFGEFCQKPEVQDVVTLACCIAMGSLEQTRMEGDSKWISAKEFHPPIHHVYWETRENTLRLANQLNIFFPDILRVHRYIIRYFEHSFIEKRAERYYPEVMSPTLLVSNVMDS